VLDLTRFRGKQDLSANHVRNVKKAERAGLVIVRDQRGVLADDHLALMGCSLTRRAARGERVSLPEPYLIRKLLESGSGELFQARLNDVALSSILVLRASAGAYYQSAGTSPEGTTLGASQFLVLSIALRLQAEGIPVFNLGGAPVGSSLARFKGGFGADPRPLERVSVYCGPAWRRKVSTVTRLAREDRLALFQAISGRITRYNIFAANPTDVAAPGESEDFEFHALGPEALRVLPGADDSFRHQQLERMAQFGDGHAYGVLIAGQIAHVSWMLPAAATRAQRPSILLLAEGEMEITSCETLPGYRGRGIYSFTIRQLCQRAREMGVRRVYMKTHPTNKASESGIRKAGLERIGLVFVITPPALPATRVVWRWYR
jgi:hypothetical protein